MPYCGNQPLRPLSLPEWLVLCIVCEKPTPGFAVAGLLSDEGSLGRIWHVPQPAIYRAMRRLTRLGFVQLTRHQKPDRWLVTATRTGHRAARGWLRKPVTHGRNVRSELILKLALLDRIGGDPQELLRDQRAEFAPLAAALASQVDATTGTEHALALWRHKTMSATMQFLDDVTRRAELGALPG
jgi:PadR family transcriptional regulator AphA